MQQIQELLRQRRQRGYAIAKSKGQSITQKDGVWLVPSASNPRRIYRVKLTIEGAKCDCEDYVGRGIRCKHAFAIDYILTKTIDEKGNAVITATKKIQYPQKWHEYTQAQNNEGRHFKELLKELVENIPEKPYTFGRPQMPLKVALFCAIDKVYSMQSSRRAHSRYQEAEAKQQIEKTPNYNHINKTLNRAEITPILNDLLHITAMPLKSVEETFSPDSTGFRTTQFSEYCKHKHSTGKEHKWIKCHAITGNKTNVITGVRITDENGADIVQFRPLVEETANMGFNMQEVSADKAYNSIDNYNAVSEIGGVAFIPYKSNTTAPMSSGSRGKLWRKMFLYFQMNQEDFLMHYHNRSNVEATFMALKAKFGDCLKNKTFVSQTNELLCKLIAYNITVLISAMYELKVQPNLLPSAL